MFPKSQRFLMIERLEGTIIEVLENIVQANETQNKPPILKESSALLERFVLDRSYRELADSHKKIEDFLKGHLKLQLHPQKTKYLKTNQGADLLGFKVFYFHRLVRRKNHRASRRNLKFWQEEYREGSLSAPKLGERIRGWISYAEHGNSYNLRKRLIAGFTFVNEKGMKAIQCTQKS